MNRLDLLMVGVISLGFGLAGGYSLRLWLARKQIGSIEKIVKDKISQAQGEAKKIISQANIKTSHIISRVEKEERRRKNDLFKAEQLLLKRESILGEKIAELDEGKEELNSRVDRLKKVKEEIEKLKEEEIKRLEEISSMSQSEAQKKLLSDVEKKYKGDILERMIKLEKEGQEEIDQKAREMIASAMQRCSVSQAQELTTTTVSLPSDDMKGRIIGREGRNIKAFEKETGVEILVDDTPGAVVISGFEPIRRQVAKVALEKLIRDGRIQPARIESVVKEAKENINSQIKKAGESAAYEAGVLDLDPKLILILGRLRFRTSFGQNVLLHSIEVSRLAGLLASELGANIKVAKKAGLLHDIGKAVDNQIEGTHVDIGIRILEKFGVEKEVIDAMKSHHGEYPYESVEAVIVQVADQISGARPGARKDTLENYIKRLGDLENIATSFKGVEKAYAIQAGREIRVFVKPGEIDDYAMHKLARDIASKIQEELRYPGEIKINVIRENRVVEYAK